MDCFFVSRKLDPAGSHNANQAFSARNLPLNYGDQIGFLGYNIWQGHREVESLIIVTNFRLRTLSPTTMKP
jgi:hypothetical protein